MLSIAQLEISLHYRLGDTYAVEMRYWPPNSLAEESALDKPVELQFDAVKLRALSYDPAAYGRCLTDMLFPPDQKEVVQAFEKVRANVRDAELRVKLYLDRNSRALHELRWELLRDPDPEKDAPLFTGQNLWCSRYLSSSDWRSVIPRSKGELRALVVIANPTNISDYNLASIDSEAELSRVKTALGNTIHVEVLAGPHKATLKNMIARLRDGFDILYLVCHGVLMKGAWLWLEDDESGKAARVSGYDFATHVRELSQRPCLAVLASCQSAGHGGGEARTVDDEGVLASLGPGLAEAGVAAVVAMNGSVTIKTVETFMPVFFSELLKDGYIDRAMAIARGTVRNRPDYWMPVLFSRLSSGCMWYESGFRSETNEKDFKKWKGLISAIQNQKCTPILGPGLLDPLVGSTRELARNWARSSNFPMAQYAREDLPQVAQYMSVSQSRDFVRTQLRTHVRNELMNRYKNKLSNEYLKPVKSLDDLFSEIGRIRREQDPSGLEPHTVLAKLDLPIYITTNPCCSLENALIAQGKTPRSEYCRWHQGIENNPCIYDDDKDYKPDSQNPLVFHMFGRLNVPESLAITEDDYFHFLIGTSQKQKRDPASVIPFPLVLGTALTNKSLMFLGFRLDEWVFRVLFSTILAQGGKALLEDNVQVAAQIEPEEGRFVSTTGTKQYLMDYFKNNAYLDIFWGSVDDFVHDLDREYTNAQGGVL